MCCRYFHYVCTRPACLKAIDSDRNADITYHITQPKQPAAPFKIDAITGQLSTTSPLDYEQVKEYTLTVSTSEAVTAGKTNPATDAEFMTTVKIKVIDVNDNSPVFSESIYEFSVLESEAPGTSIFYLNATDEDTLQLYKEPRYSIISSSPAGGKSLFDINPITGVVTVLNSLSAERTINRYQLEIEARNPVIPPLPSTAYLRIDIVRNQFDPVFSPTTCNGNARILASKTGFVTTCSATDSDTQPAFKNLTYSFVGDYPGTDYFSLDPTTAAISVKTALTSDTASTPTYYLRVVANDGGGRTGTGTVTINVDRNLHPPIFKPNLYNPPAILDVHPVSQNIVTVQATDADIRSPEKDIVYRIAGDAIAQQYFTVDPTTGAISIKQPLYLDPLKQKTYTLRQ
ncbi:cadherin-1-like [Tubulanus polymorphus]|uniref:cadherin-1-like n=1 Tax=Tubulanus polymorphus TaxID=672921 RepID=UPI003DA62C09